MLTTSAATSTRRAWLESCSYDRITGFFSSTVFHLLHASLSHILHAQ